MKYLYAAFFACLFVSITQAAKPIKHRLESPLTKKTWEPGETLEDQSLKDASILMETIFPS